MDHQLKLKQIIAPQLHKLIKKKAFNWLRENGSGRYNKE